MVNYCQWFTGELGYIQVSGLNQAERDQCVSNYEKVVSFSLRKWRKKVHIHGEKKKPILLYSKELHHN